MLIFGIQNGDNNGNSSSGGGITQDQLNSLLSQYLKTTIIEATYAKKSEVPNVDDFYTKEEINSKINSVFIYKGSVDTVNDLPQDANIGDCYNTFEDGSNYVWNGTEWDNLGGIVDLSKYYTKEEINNKIIDMVEWSNHPEDTVNSNRRTIVLKNHDSIVGTDTKDVEYNLAMISKYDVADYGSTGLHTNINSKDTVTINDNKVIATLDDIPSSETFATKDELTKVTDWITADYVSHEYLIDNYDTTADLEINFDNRYIRLDKKFPDLTINYWGGNSISYNAKAEKTLDLSKITGQAILYGDDQLNVPTTQQKTIYDVLTNLISRVEELEELNANKFGYVEE